MRRCHHQNRATVALSRLLPLVSGGWHGWAGRYVCSTTRRALLNTTCAARLGSVDCDAQQAVKCGEVHSSSHSSDPRAAVVDVSCSNYAGASNAVRDESSRPSLPRVSMSPYNPPSHASCATAVSDTLQHAERGRMGMSKTQWHAAFSKKMSGIVHTCAAPAAVSPSMRLRRALRRTVTALPYVVRSLR